MERAQQEVAGGNRSARRTVEHARRELVKEGNVEGLEQLLELANRLENGGDLPYAIRQNLRSLSRREAQGVAKRSRTPAGVLLLGGFAGGVFGIALTYWLLHGAGGDGMTWLAGGLFFLIIGVPLGGVVASLLWRGFAKSD